MSALIALSGIASLWFGMYVAMALALEFSLSFTRGLLGVFLLLGDSCLILTSVKLFTEGQAHRGAVIFLTMLTVSLPAWFGWVYLGFEE